MMQRSRGRQLVAMTPENLCIDILSSLLTKVVTIATQKQQERSPSVISDTDEEINSPPKKSQRLTFNLPHNVCRKLDFELPNETEGNSAHKNDNWTIMLPKPDAPFDLPRNDERFVSNSVPASSKDIITSDEAPMLICESDNAVINSERSENLEVPENLTDIIASEDGSMLMCEPENVVINPEQNENPGVSVEVDPLSISDLDQLLENEQQTEHPQCNDVVYIIQSQPDTQSTERPTETSENEQSNEGDQIEEHAVPSQSGNTVNDFWEQENIFQGKKRKPRKSEIESRKQRQERSLLRNTGQQYDTNTGKTKIARSIKELDDCRMKCKERIPDNKRNHFHAYYWTLGSYEERVNFVKNLIEPDTKKSTKIGLTLKNREFSNKYFFKFAGENFPICRGCLLKTLDETSKFLQVVTAKKQISAGFVQGEIKKRGGKKQVNTAQLEEAKRHILSFPAIGSHYARSQTKKKFLPSDLNIATMYKLYRESCQNRPVCLTTYTTIFRAQNISFKKPKVDTCGTCDALTAKIKVAEKDNDNNTKTELQNQLKKHQKLADDAYKTKDADKKRAAERQDSMVVAFDLQQCLPTPLLKSGMAFYKRQLWTYNLTIHVCNDNKVYCYMWDEASGARGGNQIASCVYHFICNVVNKNEKIKYLILFSDSCAGQNKNNFMIAMFLTAIKEAPYLTKIEHKFLVPGHTHLECDSDHALIEKAKKNTTLDIHVPRDWYQLVRSVSKKDAIEVIEMTYESFYNFSMLLKSEFTARKLNDKREKFLFAEVGEFIFEKELFPKVLYKTRDGDDTKTLDYTKWGRRTYNQQIQLIPCYTGPLPIAAEKKKDLESLFSFLDRHAQEFYSNLKSDESIPIFDPDLEDRSNQEI